MNDWKHLEKQLPTWTPRRPSPTLERKIFGGRPENRADAAGDVIGGWRWLAPVLGCLLVMTSLSIPRDGEIGAFAGTETNHLLAAWVSNQSSAAYIMAGFHSKQNTIGSDTLEWTNAQGMPSSVGSFPAIKTNGLVR